MKLKQIFLITLIAGVVCSCVSEEQIEVPNPPTETSQVTFTIAMSDLLSTKAKAPDAKYNHATTDELQVNKVVIAFFDKEGTRVAIETASGTKLTETTTEPIMSGDSKGSPVLAYKVENLQVPRGDNMTVIVVANSDLPYDSYRTLREFNNAIEHTPAFISGSFDPKNLIKVGKLKDFTINSVTTEIKVPMVQLAARVDLNLSVKPNDGLRSENAETKIYVSEILNGIEKVKVPDDGDFTINNKTLKGKANCTTHSFVGEQIQYGNQSPKTIMSNHKVAELQTKNNKDWLVKEETTEEVSQGIRLNKITISNILLKSNVLLSKWGTNIFSNKQTSPLGELVWVNPAEGEPGHIAEIEDKTFILTFYTYEKKLDVNPLEVTIDAEIIGGVVPTTKYYSGLHGVWYNISNNGQISDQNIYYDKIRFVVIPNSHKDFEMKNFSQSDLTSKAGKSKQIKFQINPDGSNGKTNGVIHGNLYSVSATVTFSVDVDVELKYDVVSWTEKIVTLDPFK